MFSFEDYVARAQCHCKVFVTGLNFKFFSSDTFLVIGIILIFIHVFDTRLVEKNVLKILVNG